jgi:ABC-type ATPase involved in cell division
MGGFIGRSKNTLGSVFQDAKLIIKKNTLGSVFQDAKLIIKAKSRSTGNKAVKAAFHANGWNS